MVLQLSNDIIEDVSFKSKILVTSPSLLTLTYFYIIIFLPKRFQHKSSKVKQQKDFYWMQLCQSEKNLLHCSCVIDIGWDYLLFQFQKPKPRSPKTTMKHW